MQLSRLIIAAIVAFSSIGLARADSQHFLIEGTIVTPSGPIQNGWIEIADGKIVSVGTTQPSPAGANVLVTHDLIFPGLIDLHNHPLYGVFAHWNSGRLWDNRYAWRDDPAYHDAIQDPEKALIDAGEFCDMDEFAEIQALIGGTTSLTGISVPANQLTPPACMTGLARNLEQFTGFYGSATGHERVRSLLGVFRDMTFDRGKQAHADLDARNLDLLDIHVAEGKPTDPEAKLEFTMLKSWGFLGANTAVIHGLGLSPAELAQLKSANGALIWSPRSNLELYGATLDMNQVSQSQVTVALAPDWAPSGSSNLLAEIGYVDCVVRAKATGVPQPQRLFEMSAPIPAQIAHIDDKVGTLTPGKYADLFVLKGDPADPYNALAKAGPADVTLTLVGGQPIYGTPENLTALGVTGIEPIQVCSANRGLNASALNSPFKDVVARLSNQFSKTKGTMGPIVECSPPR